jgi:hypothetical protein
LPAATRRTIAWAIEPAPITTITFVISILTRSTPSLATISFNGLANQPKFHTCDFTPVVAHGP